MDFDKPKVYGDTFISDGLVRWILGSPKTTVHKILFQLILRSRALLLLSAFAILGAQHHLAAGQLLAGKAPQGQQCLGDDGHGNQMKS